MEDKSDLSWLGLSNPNKRLSITKYSFHSGSFKLSVAGEDTISMDSAIEEQTPTF